MFHPLGNQTWLAMDNPHIYMTFQFRHIKPACIEDFQLPSYQKSNKQYCLSFRLFGNSKQF